MNVNRKVGNAFERDLCLSLAGYGFWVHNLAQNSRGQPFDVIAARNGVSYPIDCKDCARDVFRLARIEENQASAMSLWRSTGNGEGWFALRLASGAVYFFAFSTLQSLSRANKSSLSREEIVQCGIPLGKWVGLCK